jgi:hypothetical protein
MDFEAVYEKIKYDKMALEEFEQWADDVYQDGAMNAYALGFQDCESGKEYQEWQ